LITYALSIETDAGTYRYNVGSNLRVAKLEAETTFKYGVPEQGTHIITVALFQDNKLLDVYDHDMWSSDQPWENDE